ncbi:hypothetical protein D3C76_1499640 [compost metagenome]
MLQKTIHNANDPNILTEPLYPRTQTTYTTHNQIDLHAGLRSLVQFINHVLMG